MKTKKIMVVMSLLILAGLACSLSLPGTAQEESQPTNTQEIITATPISVTQTDMPVPVATQAVRVEKDIQAVPEEVVEIEPAQRPTFIPNEKTDNAEINVVTVPTPYHVDMTQLKELVIEEETIVTVKNNPYAVIKVTNPNKNIAFKDIFYHILFYDQSDYQLGRAIGSWQLIRPGETVTIVQNIYPDSLKDIPNIKSLKVSFDDMAYGGYDLIEPYQEINKLAYEEDNGLSYIKGSLTNHLNAVIQNSKIHVVAYKGGQIVGAATVPVTTSPAVGEAPIMGMIDVSEAPDRLEGTVDSGTINYELAAGDNPLRVVQTGYSISPYGNPVYVGFVVKNPGDKQFADVRYTVNVYDKEHNILATMPGTIYHIPASSEISLATSLSLSNKEVEIGDVDVVIIPGPEETASFINPFMLEKGVYDPQTMTLTVQFKNVSSQTIQYPSFHFVVFDADGAIMAGNTGTKADPLPSQESLTVSTDLYLPRIPKYIEIFPNFDFAPDNADIGKRDTNAEEMGLPDAPQGFSWKTTPAIAFLLPDGWFYKTQEDGDTTTYIVSEQSMEENDAILYTGMTVQVIENIDDPETMAKKMADDFSKAPGLTKVLTNDKKRVEDYTVFQVSAEIKDPLIQAGDTRQNKRCILIANGQQENKRVVLIRFETPSSEWEKHLDTAIALMGYLRMK